MQAVIGVDVDEEIADPLKRARNAAAHCLLFEVQPGAAAWNCMNLCLVLPVAATPDL